MTDSHPRSHESGFRNDFTAPVHSLVQAGTIQHHHYAPATVHDFADGRLLIGRVPGLAAGLQGRESDHVLATALDPGGTAVLCQVLSGMGGVGKTQTAASYARRCWDAGEIDLLVWVSAADRESIIAVLAAAAAQVCGADPTDGLRAAETFLSWLDRPEARPWLIVLDDLTDPDDLAGLWPPNTPRGHTIVTTRRRDAALDAHGRSRINFDLFTVEEGRAFLKTRLGAHTAAHRGAEALIAATARLPLALAQAAAFILDQPGMTCESYADMLNDRTVQLTHLSPERLSDEYPVEVAACWAMSIEAADREAPLGVASRLMAVASLLDPAGIPVELFTTEEMHAALNESAAAENELVEEPIQVLKAFARLHRLSLLDFDGRSIRVHALVQHAVRDRLSSTQLSDAALTAAGALGETWPEVENDQFVSANLRANTSYLRLHAFDTLLESDSRYLLFTAGHSLGEAGRVMEAVAYFDDLHAGFTATLGPDHPDTLTTRNEAAHWLGEAGDLPGAIARFEALLADRARALGPDHIATVKTRANLASWRADSDDARGALADNEALLPELQRILGADHPDVLTLRNNAAFALGEYGEAAAAFEAFAALLPDQLRVLGPDDPDTLRTRGNLANCQGESGDAAGAMASYAALLVDELRVFGPDHPRTFLTRENLAWWQGESGDAAGAVAALETLLDDRLRVFGPDHVDTPVTRGGLAHWRGRAEAA